MPSMLEVVGGVSASIGALVAINEVAAKVWRPRRLRARIRANLEILPLLAADPRLAGHYEATITAIDEQMKILADVEALSRQRLAWSLELVRTPAFLIAIVWAVASAVTIAVGQLWLFVILLGLVLLAAGASSHRRQQGWRLIIAIISPRARR